MALEDILSKPTKSLWAAVFGSTLALPSCETPPTFADVVGVAADVTLGTATGLRTGQAAALMATGGISKAVSAHERAKESAPTVEVNVQQPSTQLDTLTDRVIEKPTEAPIDWDHILLDPRIQSLDRHEDKVVFALLYGGNNEIYIANAEGKNTRRLTFTPGIDELKPKFVNNGQNIFYTSLEKLLHPARPNLEIETKTRNLIDLNGQLNRKVPDFYVSPYGSGKIVFFDHDPNLGLCINISDENLQNIKRISENSPELYRDWDKYMKPKTLKNKVYYWGKSDNDDECLFVLIDPVKNTRMSIRLPEIVAIMDREVIISPNEKMIGLCYDGGERGFVIVDLGNSTSQRYPFERIGRLLTWSLVNDTSIEVSYRYYTKIETAVIDTDKKQVSVIKSH